MKHSARFVVPLFGASWMVGACGSKWSVEDVDGDGVTSAAGDCWDALDGPPGSGLTGRDIHPNAVEVWYDGIDQNCAGDDDYDADGDGWVVEAEHLGLSTLGVPTSGRHVGSGDCWDAPSGDLDPSHVSLNDLPQLSPEQVHPAAEDDVPYDGIDRDCAGDDDFDVDRDGHGSDRFTRRDGSVGDDCNDDDPSVSPSVPLELCNDIDDDCDGLLDSEDDDIDESTMRLWSSDDDADGYGAVGSEVESCSRIEGRVQALGDDCDDTDASIHPDAVERCNAVDDDCDAAVDDDDPDVDHSEGAVEAWRDGDGDGFGDPLAGDTWCEPPSWAVDNTLDCDDANPDIHPDAREVCDGADNDCNGLFDDEDPGVDLSSAPDWWPDGDGDGYGDEDASGVTACVEPIGYAASSGDCDDADPAIHPAATELTGDEVDQDCDGLEVCFSDADGDGFSESGGSTTVSTDSDCSDRGEASQSDPMTDCDDGRADINPDETEVCDADNTDEDCNGLADDADTGVAVSSMSTFYADVDGDGFGDATASADACDLSSGMVRDDTDCDDSDAAINPGATEVCDSGDVDEDCDGLSDDDDPGVDTATTTVFALDDDGDGYGDPLTVFSACDAASGVVTDATDCDDTDADVNPGATEVCDAGGVDEDCNGVSNDDDAGADTSTMVSVYADSDGDGHGDASGSVLRCEASAGYASAGDDCDDGDALVSPSATEVCNDGVDNDCDAATECALSGGSVSDAPLAILGTTSGELVGRVVRMVEDLDGDGLSDILIGAPQYDGSAGTEQGAVYAMTGLDSLASPSVSGASLLVTDAAAILDGVSQDSRLGAGIDAGDIDGDGHADLFIGAPETSSWSGAVWVVSGPIDGTTSLLVDGEVLPGTGDQLGYQAELGDLDGDGLTDLIAAAPGNSLTGGGDSGFGLVRLIDGAELRSTGSLLGVTTVDWTGQRNKDGLGFSVGVSDLDGDGLDDLSMGAPDWDASGMNDAGAVFWVAGPATAGGSVAALSSATGPAAGDLFGFAVAAGGDVNGDGYADVLVGAPKSDPGGVGNDSGGAWVYSGGVSLMATAAGGVSAFAEVAGVDGGARLGTAVSFAGDVDDDGMDDVLVGAPKADEALQDSGSVYVVVGLGAGGSVSASGTSSSSYTGADQSDQLGLGVTGGHDVNGDGWVDIMMGSPKHDAGDSDAGAAWLLLGVGL